ncbi:hypothetical protein DFH09DRAFT_1281043 [Mycena vulgaris]|nr:hypothetical protein DFH09DRAFT_1281043 [Mycena vulgaris]
MVSVSLKSPFLEPISRTMQSLLAVAQTVKRNKDDCITMLEQTHELLYAIIHLHVTSDTGGELSPNMLNQLGNFTELMTPTQDPPQDLHFCRCPSGYKQNCAVFSPRRNEHIAEGVSSGTRGGTRGFQGSEDSSFK